MGRQGMLAETGFDGFVLPEELSARVPAEERGDGRDDVRLLVGSGTEVSHHRFRELPGLLRAGDVVVVNVSATLPAAVDGELAAGEPVVVHFSTRWRGGGGEWVVEVRAPGSGGASVEWARGGGAGLRSGTVVRLPAGAELTLRQSAYGGRRLWRAALSEPDAVGYLRRHGRAIRYGYTDRDRPVGAYQTVFAEAAERLRGRAASGSAEMPSAGRPFTDRMVTELVSAGVLVVPLVLDTGVASAEAGEPPHAEWYTVPEATARAVRAARAGGGRVIAVGTTVVRALESAVAAESGTLEAASGWTELVVTPDRGVRAVDGILTGLHEPRASHLLMLEAIAGRELLARCYDAALAERYLWHEFGDLNLLLRG
ncbi:S-adenosylmethionine:tRNA ribosyltransferase-isomerase [Phaeacidiphilus oryzae]|uniref:S-adenosylmethionine:tRNA ribosyltransferase-isomerase n=1 Tax=Phaeacidiphilus oryzae TaxID=348818 RepID=UPI000A9BBF73|nr:S-adenosylmethionine:tRNA ribosyltransferase-isomerase [Phaeacidiphilus oryzae]